jgi:hypothetical protein
MEIIMLWKICFITPKSSRLVGTGTKGDFSYSPLGVGGITDFEELPILKYEIKNYKIL